MTDAIKWYNYHATMALLSAENAQLDRNGGRLERAIRLQRQSAAHSKAAREIRDDLSAPILPIAAGK